jgi:hypothetical protein
MATVDKKTGKVTVQRGDTPAKIAKDLGVPVSKVNKAISANKTLAARQQAGKNVLFAGTTFKISGLATPGVQSPSTVSNNNIPATSFVAPMVSSPEPPTTAPVKTPSRDVVNLVEPPIDAATIQNLLFENIGATELVKFTRHDTVDGINPYYNIISNLSDIKRKYDPSSLISLQKPESSYFDIYTIKLDSKIPDQTYLNENNLNDYVYIDTNGDVVIELVNLATDEIAEVQIDTSGTIYRVDEL